jgi:plasmid maintenance system antidote protein VapI
MTMKNPPHPGRIVRQECIEPLGITVKEAAERLGIQRQTPQQPCEREGRDFPGNVDSAFQGLRQQP